VDRNVVVAQNLFEIFVFEGGQRFEATNLRVDRRRQGHGGARELPVLCLAGGIREKVLVPQEALLCVPAPDVLGQRAIVGELDAPADLAASTSSAASTAVSEIPAQVTAVRIASLLKYGSLRSSPGSPRTASTGAPSKTTRWLSEDRIPAALNHAVSTFTPSERST
jgi:hypothetical protein